MAKRLACSISMVVVGILCAGAASAADIALYGDARLGLGYNIDNDGGVLVENGALTDDPRAVSRVRFGVTMTGQTDAGVTFGADIRADNSAGGEGGTDGQTEGQVFVSGSGGTLTYGDTNAADEQWVGDVPGDFSLTGLTELDETRFISNGGGFGQGDGVEFAENPNARPTVRYDFDIGGFGVSVSTNRDLTDVAVGAGYTGDFAGGTWSVGIGYYDFASFVDVATLQTVPDGEQWSAALKADYGSLSVGATYVAANSDTAADGRVDIDNLLLGISWETGALSLGAVYSVLTDASGAEAFAAADGDDAYSFTGQYDLGGGATLNGGIGRTMPGTTFEAGGPSEAATIADFGIAMSF
jgi:outer membrane protein OmpU